MKVSEILQVKGNILYTVSPDAPITEAVATMDERDIGSLVVMEYGTLVGILTFREVIRAVNGNQGALGNGTVRKYMLAQRYLRGCKSPHLCHNAIQKPRHHTQIGLKWFGHQLSDKIQWHENWVDPV